MKELGVYIHIPFCKSKCNYCNFYSVTSLTLQPEYLNAIVKEIETGSKVLKDRTVTTIFIGGGTPSCLPSGGITTILAQVRKCFKVSKTAEITIECNPNSVETVKALEWKEAGVNRVSIGLQSAKDNLLKMLGRTHTKEDYSNAMQVIKNIGFSAVNTDCIIAVPRQNQTDVISTLNMAIKAGSTHISMYSLIVEPDTKMHAEYLAGHIKLPKEIKAVNMYSEGVSYLQEKGFHRYEVSNFAPLGQECKHNVNCWNMVEYIGFGAAAHSFYNERRYFNIENVEEYIKKINQNQPVAEVAEKISKAELLEETIMLGLRTAKGINLAEIEKNFGVKLQVAKQKEIFELKKHKLITVKNNRLAATDEGFYVLNQIIVRLV